MSDIDFHYDKLIIGSTLNSILYAFSYNIPIIFTSAIQIQNNIPFPFEYFDKDEDLSFFTVRSLQQLHKLYTLYSNEEKIFGIQKQKLYNQLCVSLSLAGLIPFVDKITNIKLEDNKLILIINEKEIAQVRYNTLLIFDVNEIKNIPEPHTREKEKYIVVDWYDVTCGCSHKYDYYISKDEFINQLFFYRSKRVDGNWSYGQIVHKDVVSLSFLNKEQIDNIYYSENFAALKVKEIKKQGGIKGRAIGGIAFRNMFRSIKLIPTLRNIRRINYDWYKNYDNIYFMNQYNEKEILELCKNNTEKSYVKHINKMLFHFNHRYQEIY